MPTFRYTAVDAAGKRMRGVVDAATAMAVADRLHGQGRFLLRADEVGKSGRLLDFLQADITFRRRLTEDDGCAFYARAVGHACRRVRISTTRCAFSSRRARATAPDRFFRRCAIRCGAANRLRRAWRSIPRSFPLSTSVWCVLARQAASSRTLWLTLPICSNGNDRLAATIQSALTYPIILAVASIGTIVLLLTYVLPQFTPIFRAGWRAAADGYTHAYRHWRRRPSGRRMDSRRAAVLRPCGLSRVAAARRAPCSGKGLAENAVGGLADPKSTGSASCPNARNIAAQRRRPCCCAQHQPGRAGKSDSDTGSSIAQSPG